MLFGEYRQEFNDEVAELDVSFERALHQHREEGHTEH